MKSVEALRALATRARHLAENIVTDTELARKLLACADELDEDARRMESSAATDQCAPDENVSSRSR